MKFEDFKLNPDWDSQIIKTYECFYNEIWEGNEYTRFGLDINEGDVVVDLGGSIGLFAHFAINRGANIVYSFEANPDVFNYLKLNVNQSNIIPINGFISNKSNDNFYNLKKIFTTFNLDKVDFMKIDIEGHEFDFILDANVDYLNKVSKFAIEVHMWGMYENKAEQFIKLVKVMEKFSLNGFKINIEHVHKQYNIYMLYILK